MNPGDEQSPAGPPHSARERFFHAHDDGVSHGRRTLSMAVLIVSVFVLIFSLSVRQVTAPAAASDVIQAGIAVTTDIDRTLAADAGGLRANAQSGAAGAYAIPGYPLKVFLSRDEILNSSTPQLRRIILERSAAIVYQQGLKALDRTGRQSLGRFSSQGLLDLTVGQLSRATYDRASFAAAIALLLVLISAVGLVLSSEGWGRMRRLGVAIALGAVPGLLLSGLAWSVAGLVGGGDAFETSLRDIARTVMTVPLRNYAVTLALGCVILAGGTLLARTAPTALEAAQEAEEPAEEASEAYAEHGREELEELEV